MRIRWRDPSMSPHKWLKAIVLVIAPFVLFYIVGKPLLQSYMLTHPYRRGAELTSQEAGGPVERVHFRATDGVDLAGWFVPGDGSGATIVSSHGSGADGPGTYPSLAFLNQAGYNVFILDHRGHGQSGGRFTTMGPLEVSDLVGAVAYLRSRPDVDPERIGAIGCSMGSGIVIGAAAAEPAIRAVVAESVYADLGQVWTRFGAVGLRGTPIHWSWGRPMLWAARLWTGTRIDAFKPEALIGRIHPRPVFLIQSEHDPTACTIADARRLYRAAGEPKALWVVPEPGHCAAQFFHPQEYQERVSRFFDQALRNDSSRYYGS
jgi:dipeptidyl aminopeptidase/acylaminoacyl peptidase